MIHTYTAKKNRNYRYYVCVKAHQRGWAQCETRCVSAPALENAVVEQLRGLGRNPTMLREVLRQMGAHRIRESTALIREKADIERDLKSAALEIREAASIPGGESQLADLQDRTSRLSRRLMELSLQLAATEAEDVNVKDVETSLHAFDPLWEQLSTWEQERFIRTLVERVDYNGKTGTVTLGFRSKGIRDICGWTPAPGEDHYAKQRS